MAPERIYHLIRHGSGEELLLLAVLAPRRFRQAIDRELQRRARGWTPGRAQPRRLRRVA